MSDHFLDEIADYVEGRLTPERRAAVDEHLGTCAECAAEFSFAADLRKQTIEQGLRHLEPEQVVELGTGRATTLSEARHLERCALCREELDWMRTTPAVEEVKREKIVPLPRRAGAWLLLAAAAAGAVMFLPRAGERDLARIARLEPLPVNLTRDVPADSYEENRRLGLELYSREDWREARRAFARALELRPRSEEVRLYLGSAELLDGDARAAVERLSSLAGDAADTRIREEARWLLANGHLRAGDRSKAVALLKEIAAGGGARAVESDELLDALGSDQ